MTKPTSLLRALSSTPQPHHAMRLRPKLRLLPQALRHTTRSQSSLPPSFRSASSDHSALSASPSSQVGHPTDLYGRPAIQSFRNMGRIIRLAAYLSFSGVLLAVAGFEAWHLYLEEVTLGAPSRAPDAAAGETSTDPYGWEEERVGWTGGQKGGTDPRLGFSARHALRAAWVAQNWGEGGDGSLVGVNASAYSGPGIHRDKPSNYNFSARTGGPDRGYAMAAVYIEVALERARRKGWAFPPNLAGTRTGPTQVAGSGAGQEDGPGLTLGQGDKPVDPTVRDLLMLKAGLLERIGEPAAVESAREIYEGLLVSLRPDEEARAPARVLRLAGKVGDLAAREGKADEARGWWSWGLTRAGLGSAAAGKATGGEAALATKETKGWFGFSSSGAGSSGRGSANVEEATRAAATASPAVLRATISLLSSASTHYAQSGQLSAAAALQDTALALLPPSHPIIPPSPDSAHQTLHEAWLQQRRALFTLHRASVLHAQKQDKAALPSISAAADAAEDTLVALEPLPAAWTATRSPLTEQATFLRRDAILTAAEAAYTRGVLLEKQKVPLLDKAAECFERAMEVYELDVKEGDEFRGKEWERYWRAYARVKVKLGQEVPLRAGAEGVDEKGM